jgi:hypothetical protein
VQITGPATQSTYIPEAAAGREYSSVHAPRSPKRDDQEHCTTAPTTDNAVPPRPLLCKSAPKCSRSATPLAQTNPHRAIVRSRCRQNGPRAMQLFMCSFHSRMHCGLCLYCAARKAPLWGCACSGLKVDFRPMGRACVEGILGWTMLM